VVGLVFSLFHGQFYGLFSRWLLGVILGYLAIWSGSIWPAVAAHFTNNALNAAFGYFAFNGEFESTAVTDPQTQVPWFWALPSAALVFFGLYWFRSWNKKSPEPGNSSFPGPTLSSEAAKGSATNSGIAEEENEAGDPNAIRKATGYGKRAQAQSLERNAADAPGENGDPDSDHRYKHKSTGNVEDENNSPSS
jgi:hypothetical protein